MNLFDITLEYLYLGITHVIPYGYDHILFIISIIISASDIRRGIIQCSIFTLSHSISLALSASDFILNNTSLIEPLIALTLLFSSLDNIIQFKNYKKEMLLFLFGLIHGMGFASSLKESGIYQEHFFASLFSFNLGVELGQIMIIVFIYYTFLKWFRQKKWYERNFLFPASSIIGCIAIYWTIERILNFQ